MTQVIDELLSDRSRVVTTQLLQRGSRKEKRVKVAKAMMAQGIVQ